MFDENNVNWEFSLKRWKKTIMHTYIRHGEEEVRRRTSLLPKKFDQALAAYIKGKYNGEPYN